MNCKKILVQSSTLFSLLLAVLFLLNSCANIIPPSGGARDSLPPKLVMALPKDSAINISPKQITIQFDEYITLDNVQQNLIVSPTLKTDPLVDYKLKNISIKIKDSLEANTTYSLNFGNAIRDVNESNILKDFRYVFSTGNKIDNYSYKGIVFLAEKGRADSTLIVVLHNKISDSAIVKLRPRYYTRINSKGEFVFNNLSSGTYGVFVVPNDYSKRYDDSTKLFAFRNEPLIVKGPTPTDTLYAFEAFKQKPKTTTTVVNKNKVDKTLKISTSLETSQQDLLSPLVLSFNRPLKSADSSKIYFTDTNRIAIKNYQLLLDTSKTKLSIVYNWKEKQSFRLIVNKDAVVDTGGALLAKADTIKFTTKKEIEYGSIRLRFANLNLQKNPVLQFFQSDKLIESVPLTASELIRKLFFAGTYELRILYDTNKNGIWDTGFFGNTKKQPEVVQLISKPLSIRGNWDNEVNINL